jgi:hypothetical protein
MISGALAQAPALVPISGPWAHEQLLHPARLRVSIDERDGRLGSGSSATITTRPIELTFFGGPFRTLLAGSFWAPAAGSCSTGRSRALAQYSRPGSRSPFRAVAMDRAGGARTCGSGLRGKQQAHGIREDTGERLCRLDREARSPCLWLARPRRTHRAAKATSRLCDEPLAQLPRGREPLSDNRGTGSSWRGSCRRSRKDPRTSWRVWRKGSSASRCRRSRRLASCRLEGCHEPVERDSGSQASRLGNPTRECHRKGATNWTAR